MRRAILLGERGRRTTAPNPWVGCVLVRDGAVVAEGFHRAAGEPHAEANALKAAGDRAAGTTAYVSLEPHAHQGRTPPCTEALIAAGVSRVVVAQLDPDPQVRGRGIQRLTEAGVEVTVGVCEAEAAESLAPYLHQRRTGRAYSLLKAAASLDGRTAAVDGTSQWITGPAARRDVHEQRAESQAIVVGAGTALADKPTLTVRGLDEPPVRAPLRVLLDSSGRVPAEGPLFDTALTPTLVFTTKEGASKRAPAWQRAGAEVVVLARSPEGGVDLQTVLTDLANRGVIQAMFEGGAEVHGALLRAGLVDRLTLYVGAVTLGQDGRPLIAGAGPTTITEAPRWRLRALKRLGDDVRLDYDPLS